MVIVLFRQNFRRGHQCCLLSVDSGQIGGSGGHHGFAAAHVSLNQPVHGLVLLKVGGNLINGPPLCAGQGKGQLGQKRGEVLYSIGHVGNLRAPGPHHGQTHGKNKEFLKNQPLLCHSQGIEVGGMMDGFIGVGGVAQAEPLPHLERQHLRQTVPADMERRPNGLDQNFVGNPGGETIEGQNAPGQDAG